MNHTKNVTQAKNSTTNHTKNVTQAKNSTQNHTKNVTQDHKKNSTHDNKKKEKSDDEIEHESGQLDNLFLTLRESLVTDTIIVEDKPAEKSKKHTKKKHLHHKGKGKKNVKKHLKPGMTTLLMLDTDEKQKVVVGQTIAEKVNQQINQKVKQQVKQTVH